MTRLRVLHIVGNLDLGGGQKLTALVADGLDRTDFDVAVVNLGRRGHYSAWLTERGVRVIDLEMPMSPRLGDVRRVVAGLRGLMRVLFATPRWDIVHTHMFRTSILCTVPARVAGSRVFGTVHRIYFPWQPFIERVFARLQEAIVVDSLSVGRILQVRTKIPQDRYVVIHDGIDTSEFDAAPTRAQARLDLGLPASGVIVAEIAALAPHKGQRHLIAAMAEVFRDYAEARLLLVGDGPDGDLLARSVVDLGLTDRVSILAARPDLAAILSAVDIVALPSTYEGFGIILAEAGYLGLPTIASEVGGSSEVVLDGVTGFLVPFGDVSMLATRLGQLIADAALRATMGAGGRARVIERFTQARMCAQYERLYRGQINRGLEEAPSGVGTGP